MAQNYRTTKIPLNAEWTAHARTLERLTAPRKCPRGVEQQYQCVNVWLHDGRNRPGLLLIDDALLMHEIYAGHFVAEDIRFMIAAPPMDLQDFTITDPASVYEPDGHTLADSNRARLALFGPDTSARA